MASAGCRYSSALLENDRLEDTALDIGKGQMLRKAVAFWNDRDRCCFSQDCIKMNGKGGKHNQQMSSHDKIWHKLQLHRVRLPDKRLCRCLCGIVPCAVY